MKEKMFPMYRAARIALSGTVVLMKTQVHVLWKGTSYLDAWSHGY